MQITELPIKDLKPYANNPRKNDPAVQAVANSIKEFGFKVPIVIDKNNEIVCGHTRYKAAKKLKLKTVPCVIANDLSEEQIKAYRLADNKVGELAEWDFDVLADELSDIISLDMSDFGFAGVGNNAWFERDEKDGAAREEGNEEYNDFLEKFEAKKTTDDCYTPENIYNAVADYVAEYYGLDKKKFVRPFYPGGDYQKQKYASGIVVVDNPPFSILSEIRKFYIGKGIKYFLFAPMTSCISSQLLDCAVCANATIVYENGASVSTSFVTNLESNLIRSAPALSDALKIANDENLSKMHKSMPKYEYPDYVVTAAKAGWYSIHHTEFKVERGNAVYISEMDEQKEAGKGIFGGGLLLSEKAAAEKAAAEKAAAEKWQLSEREKEIVATLGKE